ncbi:M48 family metallopeptidase [Janthinobacterium fluminis]|uniref:M48 family metallopeptidase n=1 Tax=Janthinobacterium fluminis TaxID=2987524 RepID=A0ABT5K5C8_9BURK|nr:M48 family metallopeptidase [Janthinobacterium fluminis]MDC8760207.1 M48 family metallopeptidase [Janthinobacterium fluminis]
MEDGFVVRDYPPFSVPGKIRTYAKEQSLFKILAVFAALFWLLLTVVTVGTVLLALPVLYLFGLLGRSYFIAQLQGNAVQIGPQQLPQLHARLQACCQAVGLDLQPEFYLMSGNGVLNAFATRFLRRYYVVLLSDIVDALHDDEDALNFYIGHELGHIAQKHLARHWWLSFVMLTPLLGAAYARAREYSCDQYGLACCHDTDSAMRALAVLAAGSKRWKTVNLDAYMGQSERSGGFWMSLNELTGDYPWLCKRIARVQRGDAVQFPRRHWLAWGLSALVLRTGFGAVGGLLLYLYLGVTAVSLAIPAYEQYQKNAGRAERHARGRVVEHAYANGLAAASNVELFLVRHKRLPATVAEAGFTLTPQMVRDISIDQDSGRLSIAMVAPLQGQLLYLTPVPQTPATGDGKFNWICSASPAVPEAALPRECRAAPEPAADDA